MIFNFKDWVSYVNLSILIFVIFEFVIYWDTLVRWKWGYWSIDLVPAVVILLFWMFVFINIRIDRVSKRVYDLEEERK